MNQDILSYFANLVYNSLDKGVLCLGIFVDVAKAFDSVSDVKLLEKFLKKMGKNFFWLWFKSYLVGLSNKP